MSGENITKSLNGQKTETRRVIEPQPRHLRQSPFVPSGIETNHGREVKPKCKVGDLVYCKETWAKPPKTAYWHDQTIPHRESPDGFYWAVYKACWERSHPYWRSPLHMPQWASRCIIKITSVSAERLWAITQEGAEREGAFTMPHRCAGDPEHNGLITEPELPWCEIPSGIFDCRRCGFRMMWDALNAKRGYPWESNPWVWVYGYEVQP